MFMFRAAVVGVVSATWVGAELIGGLDAINECAKGAACGAITGYSVKGWGKQAMADMACSAIMEAAGVDFARPFRSPDDEKAFQKGMDAGSAQAQQELYKPYMKCVQQKMVERKMDQDTADNQFMNLVIECGYKKKEEPAGGWNFFNTDVQGGAINLLCGAPVDLLATRAAQKAEENLEKKMAEIAKRAAKKAARAAERRAVKAAEKRAAEVAKKRAAEVAKRVAEKRAARIAKRVAQKRAARIAKIAAEKAAERAAERAAARASARAAERGLLRGLFSLLAELPPQSNATNATPDDSMELVNRLAEHAAEHAAAKAAADATAAKAQKAFISKAVGYGAMAALLVSIYAVYKLWKNKAYAVVNVKDQPWPMDTEDLLPPHGKGGWGHQPGAGYALPPRV